MKKKGKTTGAKRAARLNDLTPSAKVGRGSRVASGRKST